MYDPYRLDRKNHKKADRYIRDIEKAAVKEVELEEKALAKQARKQEKLELKEEARQERAAKRRERKNRRDEKLTGWKESIREKLPAKKKAAGRCRGVRDAGDNRTGRKHRACRDCGTEGCTCGTGAGDTGRDW